MLFLELAFRGIVRKPDSNPAGIQHMENLKENLQYKQRICISHAALPARSICHHVIIWYKWYYTNKAIT